MHFTARNVGKTSLRIPTLGFGGAPLGGLFDTVDGAEASETLRSAHKSGMTYVDTAPFYGFGRSERRVGDMLRGKDYVLSTKVGRILTPGVAPDAAALGWQDALPFKPVFNYSYDGIMRSFEDSLQRLGLDRIDILYVHDIEKMLHGAEYSMHFNTLAQSGYRALDQLRREGRVRAIGIGVNETEACINALKIGDWDVFLLAGRYTLLEQGPMLDLFPQCSARGVSIVVGGPFNSGVLAGGNTWNYGAVPKNVLEKVKRLSQICGDFGVPLPAAALQFPLGQDVVGAVIPGLRNQRELADTLIWVACDIPGDFWRVLKETGAIHPDTTTPPKSPFLKVTD